MFYEEIIASMGSDQFLYFENASYYRTLVYIVVCKRYGNIYSKLEPFLVRSTTIVWLSMLLSDVMQAFFIKSFFL